MFPDGLVPTLTIGVVALLIVLVLTLVAVRRRKRPKLPSVLHGVRVDVTAPVAVGSDPFEVVWSIPLILTNVSRHPARIPPLSGDALVRAGKATYRADVLYGETGRPWVNEDGTPLELNPTSTSIGEVSVTLPAGEIPAAFTLSINDGHGRTLHWKKARP